jgi:hypothetical protein
VSANRYLAWIRRRPAVAAATLAAATLALVVPLILVGVARPGPMAAAAPVAAKATFIPVADAYVNSRHPHTNYGDASALRTDGAPHPVRSYLRFQLRGLTGTVRSATLRLFAESGSRRGLKVQLVTDTGWGERTLEYATAPPLESAAVSVAPFRPRRWITANVTALVKGNGDLTIALVGLGPAGIRYASREAGLLTPQLVVETAGGDDGRRTAPVRVAPFNWATTPSSGEAVVAAAGDIACPPREAPSARRPSCQQKSTSDLLTGLRLDAVLPLGDLQYEAGGLAGFEASYGPTWGRFKAITHPVVGNHEYGTPDATGYFSYFGSAAGDPSKGWYSYNLGSWHLIALNSECAQVGGCGAGSAQERWLKADLAAHRTACTLAYWHEPRFSSGHHGSNASYDAFWRDLYDAGAEIVLNGHDHDYERFAPQNPDGRLDLARGIREFVAGTGGVNHYHFKTVRPNSEVRGADTFGVLLLRLGSERYQWQFVPEAGKEFTDAGTGLCH